MPTPPTIVALDGYTLNPGDLSWDPIASLAAAGHFTVHDRTPPAEILARALPAQILLTNKTPLSAELLAQLPNLKLICVTATGVNVVDTLAARARGIPVCNIPLYGTDSVAQFTIALILELAHRVGLHSDLIHAGEWPRREWCFYNSPQVELAGKTLGLIGFGRIGRRVADIAHALGMHVLAFARTHRDAPHYRHFAWASLEEIYARADVISLHIPLTPENKHLINPDTLARMKPGAWLINTARGPLLDDAAVAAALTSGHLGGAALDVATVEPIHPDNPLLKAPNCVLTPHIAWATLAARQRLMSQTAENIAAFLAGKPQNVVN